jgi:hypothetical protein
MGAILTLNLTGAETNLLSGVGFLFPIIKLHDGLSKTSVCYSDLSI